MATDPVTNTPDLDAIRARADRYAQYGATDRGLQLAGDIPALLALVDAQAARIDKALAACDLIAETFESDSIMARFSRDIRRALTEDVTP